jgi:hypothetical protein
MKKFGKLDRLNTAEIFVLTRGTVPVNVGCKNSSYDV